MIWIIAWKNVWRNRIRSIVVILAITFGLFGGVFSSAVMKGVSDQRVREAVSRETAHLQIHNPKYTEDNEIQYVIQDKVLQSDGILDSVFQIQAWSSRIKFQAMAASANANAGVMVYGIDPLREKSVSDIYKTICDTCGGYFETERPYPIVIGSALAEKLKLKLHSKIIITFQDTEGTISGGAFRICGIFKTNNSVFDETNVFVGKTEIAYMLMMDPGHSHEIAIRLHEPEKTDLIKSELASKFPGLLVRTWKEIDPLVGIMVDFMDLWLYLFMTIILLALAFGIVNTMLMVILERTRELGMLTAIGMNKNRVFLMIVLESVYLSLTGGFGGMALGYFFSLYKGYTGIDLSNYTRGFEKLGYSPVIFPALDVTFFIVLTLMVMIIGIISSLYPARKALRLNPADAIRTE